MKTLLVTVGFVLFLAAALGQPLTLLTLDAGERFTYEFSSLPDDGGNASADPLSSGYGALSLRYGGALSGGPHMNVELFETDLSSPATVTCTDIAPTFFSCGANSLWQDGQGALRITALRPVVMFDMFIWVRSPNPSTLTALVPVRSAFITVPEPCVPALVGAALTCLSCWRILRRHVRSAD